MFCRVCHSDIRQVRNEWGSSVFPIVPGHEIVGKVTQVDQQFFCAENAIASVIEIIPIQQISEAYERVLKSDAKYRFVIYLASLK